MHDAIRLRIIIALSLASSRAAVALVAQSSTACGIDRGENDSPVRSAYAAAQNLLNFQETLSWQSVQPRAGALDLVDRAHEGIKLASRLLHLHRAGGTLTPAVMDGLAQRLATWRRLLDSKARRPSSIPCIPRSRRAKRVVGDGRF